MNFSLQNTNDVNKIHDQETSHQYTLYSFQNFNSTAIELPLLTSHNACVSNTLKRYNNHTLNSDDIISTLSEKGFSVLTIVFQKRCNSIHDDNGINEVDNIKLQIGNKVEKLKLFFDEGSQKALNIFGHFLMGAIESRQQTVGTRSNQTHQKHFEEVDRHFFFQQFFFFLLCSYGSVNLDLFIENIQ